MVSLQMASWKSRFNSELFIVGIYISIPSIYKYGIPTFFCDGEHNINVSLRFVLSGLVPHVDILCVSINIYLFIYLFKSDMKYRGP